MSVMDASPSIDRRHRTIAFLGNPNVGKTTLFNRIAGIRAKTANFPGTTQEARVAHIVREDVESTLIDLPGIYSLNLDLSESRVCAACLDGTAAPKGEEAHKPDALLVVLDATNLMRNLTIVAESLDRRLPTVVAVNMIDSARRRGIGIDADRLSEMLGCEVVVCSARTGEGIDEVLEALRHARVPDRTAPTDQSGIERWSQDVYLNACAPLDTLDDDHVTDRLDRAFTHPILGVCSFALVMTGLFYVIFKLAAIPMDLIDVWFGSLGGWVGGMLPDGAIKALLVDGVIAGVGGTVIFLPQICLLFFLLALLEGTGYLARAAFVIDRLLRPFGMSGHAFVPLLSSHACAIPGIMATRAIPDRRDRLAAILIAPFMSCTARIPVYVLLIGILFPDQPGTQAIAFTGCYVLGATGGLLTSLIARRTILNGKSRPMALELPSYRIPDLKSALLLTLDRGTVFLKKAGTLIVAISIVLWWLDAYPQNTMPITIQEEPSLKQTFFFPDGADGEYIERVQQENVKASEQYEKDLAAYEAQHYIPPSYLQRIGSTIQPVFAPLGYNDELTVGVLASFAAREVFVSTMAVQVAGNDDIEDESVLEMIKLARRDDGSPIFNAPTAWSLLVFYVFASLCLPTTVVTAKESGGWRWAFLQLGWMSAVAYAGALIAYTIVGSVGG